MNKQVIATVIAACMIWVPATQAQSGKPYTLPGYRVGMNGGNPGASQWIIFDLNVYPDGTITAPLVLENNVWGEGFCGTIRLELHDLRDNALLFAAESTYLCIGSKGLNGHAVRSGPKS